jgi:acyl-coenzyme A synthetase/AMP-(fatty) acid ligase
MPQSKPASLLASLLAAGNLSSRVSAGAGTSWSWGELASASEIKDRVREVGSRSILVAMIDQMAAVAALIQLDGVARRIVLYPPDLSLEHLPFVADCAQADVIVTDEPALKSIDSRVECIVPSKGENGPGNLDPSAGIESEWILLTSGTTGVPKLVVHTLRSLTAAIDCVASPSIVWSTFYDVRRYGGLQIFLRALRGRTSLVLKSVQESIPDFLTRAGALGVSHILGTPSHWRRVLMSPSADRIAPAYVRLSGEIADQAVLNQLRSQYPQARIAHAFASTEAGLVFEVNDCLMGCPSDAIGHNRDVEMKAEDGTLKVRSPGTAFRYLGKEAPALKDAEGFVDTGDAFELRDGRYYFVGRRDGMINVGGFKVHPEEIEAVINRHPEVSMSLVKAKKNPITGALVIADVVLKSRLQSVDNIAHILRRDILQFCREELAQYKVPAAINFVPALAVAQTGKLIRHA